MSRNRRSKLKPNVAMFVPFTMLPALVMATRNGDDESRWSDPSTWWGVATGILLGLTALGIRLVVAHRDRGRS